MHTNVKFILFLFVAAVIGSSGWLIPGARMVHLELAVSIAFATSITLLGAAWYFLSGVRTFRPQLKRAYTFLSLGILSFTLALLAPSLVIPIVSNLVAALSADVFSIMIVGFYVLSSIGMYIGMRTFAKVLAVRHAFNSTPFMVGIAIVGGLLTVWIMSLTLLKAAPLHDQLLYGAIYGFLLWAAIFVLGATVLAIRIRQIIGPVYKAGMMWLVIALASMVFALLHELIIKNLFIDSVYAAKQLTLWPYLLNGVLFLRAGLAFRETSSEFVKVPPNPSYADVITAVSQMVSQPAAIDKALDKMRAITANQSSQDMLSATDKAALLDTYIYLESYLTNEEPVHRLTREGLRNNLPEAFLADLDQREKATNPGV